MTGRDPSVGLNDALTVRVPVAARVLGIGKTKLYELISAREIDVIKVGRATLIVVRSLERFVERQSVAAGAEPSQRRGRGRPRHSFARLAAGTGS